MRTSLQFARTLALSALLLLAAASARAQDEGGLPTTPRPAPARTPATHRTTTTVRDPKRARANPGTGDLSVASESGALLEVSPLAGARGPRPLSRPIPAGERLLSFNDLRPGSYRVSARLEGFRPAEETVTVAVNKVTTLTLELEPVTYSVVVNTNVRTGELQYGAARDPRRVARIERNRAALSNLRAGTYGVEIVPEDASYERYRGAFTLPTADDKYELTFNLERRLSTGTLAELWLNLEGWDAPAGWRAEQYKLTSGSPGTALPRNEAYRYYADFKLVSDVRMLDDVGVSYALRAQDSRNYYLVQLTGSKADEPFVLRAYAVRDGTPRRLQPPISVMGNSDVLKAGKDLTVTFEFSDNRIAAFIKDNSVGEDLPLGVITDTERVFKKGAVGPASRAGERAVFSRFVVCDLQSCPKEQ
jgi:PEGA domain